MTKLAKKAKSQQMAYMEMVKTRCEAAIYVGKHGLQSIHAFLSLNNRGAGNPYHNTDHILTITKYCGRLAGMSQVPLESEKALIAAAMFHDIDHTGGIRADVDNIGNALIAFTRFIGANPTVLTAEEQAIAIKCIECTVFPFTVEPVMEVQKIIRDADLLQSTESNFEHILGEQLRAEISVMQGKNVTRKQFAKGQSDFLNSITMYTFAGSILMAAVKPIIMQRFEEISEGR